MQVLKYFYLSAAMTMFTLPVTNAFATGSLGASPSCDSGGVKVGHAPCGKKDMPKEED